MRKQVTMGKCRVGRGLRGLVGAVRLGKKFLLIIADDLVFKLHTSSTIDMKELMNCPSVISPPTAT